MIVHDYRTRKTAETAEPMTGMVHFMGWQRLQALLQAELQPGERLVAIQVKDDGIDLKIER